MKKLRGVHISESRQKFIRYTCLTYEDQPAALQRKIDKLLAECGGAYESALREVMCGEESITAIALRHFVSEATLYRLRKGFYESWFKKGRKRT